MDTTSSSRAWARPLSPRHWTRSWWTCPPAPPSWSATVDRTVVLNAICSSRWQDLMAKLRSLCWRQSIYVFTMSCYSNILSFLWTLKSPIIWLLLKYNFTKINISKDIPSVTELTKTTKRIWTYFININWQMIFSLTILFWNSAMLLIFQQGSGPYFIHKSCKWTGLW